MSKANDKLARVIATAIFNAPYGWNGDKVQRIAFRGGTDEKETDMGGYCYESLVSCIRDALDGAET
jgi:hypothetical protein